MFASTLGDCYCLLWILWGKGLTLLNEPIVFLCVAHLVSSHLVCIRLFSQPTTAVFSISWHFRAPRYQSTAAVALLAGPIQLRLTAWSYYPEWWWHRTWTGPYSHWCPVYSEQNSPLPPSPPTLKLTSQQNIFKALILGY